MRHPCPTSRRPAPGRGVRAATLFAVLALFIAGASLAQTTAIPLGATWKYDTTGTDLGTAWRDAGYLDYTWAYGPAPLGYGDPFIVTTVPYGPDPNNKYPTQYFRRSFTINGAPANVQSLVMSVSYDDGFVAYINGVEVARRSLPAGTIGYDTLATNHEGGTYETIDLTAGIPLLLQGANFMAVEVHQQAPNSSDLAWDASLTYDAIPLVTRGPYLQIGTPSGVVVRWRTNLPADTRVLYGTSIGHLDSSVSFSPEITEHEVTLTGLSAGTRYYYSVGTSTDVLEGDDTEHTFVTSPPPGTVQPIRLWVIGDSGTGNTIARAVRDAYLSYAAGDEADVWLMLGDNAYGSGTDAEYQTAVFDMYEGILKRTILWPTRGNHDHLYVPPASDYYSIFSMPTSGQAGGLASGTEAYYSFDYGNVHLICLDSEGTDRSPGGAMLTWLQNDLASTTQDWVIAFWHHPPYSHGSHNSDNPLDSGGAMRDMRENALPILDAGGADLVLVGHSHNYERSFLLKEHYGVSSTLAESMKVDPGDGRPDGDGPYEKPSVRGPLEGTVYTVAGSSGGQLSGGTLDHPVMITSSMAYGSLVIDIEGLRMDSRFIDNTGAVYDSFAVIKGTAVGVPGRVPAVARAWIAPARPNPSGARTAIRYAIPVPGAIRLSVLDLTGRRVCTLFAGEQEAGPHEIAWDGADDRGRMLGAGVYFVTLDHGGESVAQKLIRVR